MANITAKDVADLRAKTGIGMMECKKALVEAEGDVEKAIKILREKGELKAESKMATRIAADGIVDVLKEGDKTAIIEVNTETDFVAKNEIFKTFVKNLLKCIIDTNPQGVDALLASDYEGATVEYAFLPMGVARPNVRSGRWSVLCAWGYTGKQASFVINPNDDSLGVGQKEWDAFIKGILDGTNEGKTLVGYDGYNIIDNGRSVITYIHCSETAPMVTIMSFANGEVTVEYNEELHFWIDITH